MKIKRIAEIQNFSIFKDFDWSQNLSLGNNQFYDFKDINIFYGRNYSGKTSLSKIIRSLEKKALPPKYDNPNFKIQLNDDSEINQSTLSNFQHSIHVYNSDFVKEHLKFIHDENANIESFSVTLGGDNQKILDHIQKLKNELGSNETASETGVYLLVNQKALEVKNVIKIHLDKDKELLNCLSRKASGNQDSIRNQHLKFGDSEYNITKLRKEIELVQQPTYTIVTDAEKIEFESLIDQRDLPEPPPLPVYDLKFIDLINSTDSTLKTVVGRSEKIDELVSDVNLSNWVQTGFNLHHDRETCAFCNNQFDEERRQKLGQHFNEETQKLQTRIKNGIQHLENELRSSSLNINFDITRYYEQYHDELYQLKSDLEASIDKQKTSIEQLQVSLKQKSGLLFTTLDTDYPKNYSEEIKNILKEISAIRTACIELNSKLASKQKEAKETLRLNHIYHFLQDINYNGLKANIDLAFQAIDSPTQELHRFNKRRKEILEEIEIEENKLKSEGEACKRINDILQHDFGHQHLSLAPIETDTINENVFKFEIQRIKNGNKEKAHNLSEGESSLISFCYFLAKIQDSLDQDKKPIIWIDDPICSLDNNHIFFIYTLINEKICLQGNFLQLFISTHNLDFLKYLKRLNTKVKRSGENITLEACKYLISRTENNSQISKMPKYMSEYATEFNYLFNQIHTCATTNLISDHNFSSFYNFSNNARKFIEIYSFYKFPTYMKYDDDRLKEFWNDDIYRLFIGRINNEYSHCSGVLERGMSIMDEPEMQRAAQAIIEKVQKDTDQYNSLLESIGITAS